MSYRKHKSLKPGKQQAFWVADFRRPKLSSPSTKNIQFLHKEALFSSESEILTWNVWPKVGLISAAEVRLWPRTLFAE